MESSELGSMKGDTFVKMFRIQWNACVGKYHHRFFDSYSFFKIKYVFGGFECKSEYCIRKNIIETLDAILNKCIYLYLRSLESGGDPVFSLDFSSYMDWAQIYVKSGECNILISIEPTMKNHD